MGDEAEFLDVDPIGNGFADDLDGMVLGNFLSPVRRSNGSNLGKDLLRFFRKKNSVFQRHVGLHSKETGLSKSSSSLGKENLCNYARVVLSAEDERLLCR